jgi:hypothetical protein
MTVETTQAPGVTAQLDAIALFLESLSRQPVFDGKQKGLEQLIGAARTARDEAEARTGEDYDVEGFDWLMSLGLLKGGPLGAYELDMDISGAAVNFLAEQIESLAQQVIGVEWDAEARAWRES